MEETIKGKEVIAYKGMEFNMTCKGFQYEIGKTYKTYKAELCQCWFHACLNPRDVLDYYLKEETSCYFKVKLSGEITKCDEFDTEVTATEMTILEEINIDEVINNTEWWKTNNVLDLLYYQENFAKVQRANGDWNFINKQGKLLSNEWFMYVYEFSEGFAAVEKTNGEYNFIDKKGNILSNKWFIDVGHFKEGFAKVQRADGLQNYIDRQGNILSNEWFNWGGNFCEGFAGVRITNGEWRKIDKTGKLYRH